MAEISPTGTSPFEDPKKSLFSNIIAIIGFIILITVVIWGLVHLASISRNWFSSLFGKSSDAITVSAPATVVSEQSFSVSWKYNEPVKGTYAFLYQCKSGFQFQTLGPSGTQYGIPCGAAFTLTSTEKTLPLKPFLSGTSSLEVPLSIIFMPSATGTKAEGSATVKVSASASNPTPAQTTPTPTPTPTPTSTSIPTPTPAPAPKPITPADLSVHIISASTDVQGMTAVVFDIANDGGSATGSYYFTAQLPTSASAQGYGGTMQSGYTYTSPLQAPLSSGSHIVNTLRFTQVTPGGGMVSVFVDPSNMVHESNESNNYVSQFVNAPMYNNYNYNNNPYNYQYQQPSPYAQGYGGTQYTTYYPYAY